jgi:hypothetical protein
MLTWKGTGDRYVNTLIRVVPYCHEYRRKKGHVECERAVKLPPTRFKVSRGSPAGYNGCSPQSQSTKSGIGYDCPFYDEGMCRVGGGDNRCSLGVGKYWTHCHVYSQTGLKGEYDKKKGKDARRRVHLKKCERCNVTLEVSEDVDFRHAIGVCLGARL